MPSFYLDEDIPVMLSDLLRVQGHTATTTRDEGRLGNPDPAQILFAADSAMIFVTHNRADFARLHEAWLTWARGWDVARSHAGIIWHPVSGWTQTR
jgi:predicted nuclease of predicted toxin-antitoxin system